jgi:hypothetical protein
MVVSRGESIPAPNHFQGNTATVITQPDAAALVNGIVTGGYPHHLVISRIRCATRYSPNGKDVGDTPHRMDKQQQTL